MRSESIAGVVPIGRWDCADLVARMLAEVGVRHAFGVSGGGIGRIWRALIDNPAIETLHFRHEAGAAFAAIEASLESARPVVVFSTTGPGITNTLTGLAAARGEGARVLLISPRTSPAQRGRGAVQETPMPSADFFTPGWLFDDVFVVESVEELPQVAYRLRSGFHSMGAYVAHLSIPVSLQNAPVPNLLVDLPNYRLTKPFPDLAAVRQVANLMIQRRFAIWVGHGARHASRQIRALVNLTGAPVLATPRGKGIVPEHHPQFVMVTGLGGHPQGIEHLERYAPEFVLVLGSRLGEPSSGWDTRLVPPCGFVHVDVNPSVAGRALGAPVLAIESEIGAFLDQILKLCGEVPHRPFHCPSPFVPSDGPIGAAGLVRPQALFEAVQSCVIDAGIPVLVEPGSAMAWASHQLVLSAPGQLRIVGSFGSMGHMACGVIGCSVSRCGPAVCVTGDGSLLMNNEINTAVEYGVPAIWLVLNNGGYQMCEKGMGFGPEERHARFVECDFAAVARAMGAEAERVRDEPEIGPVLRRAVSHDGPFLVDVLVDPSVMAPFESRIRTLKA